MFSAGQTKSTSMSEIAWVIEKEIKLNKSNGSHKDLREALYGLFIVPTNVKLETHVYWFTRPFRSQTTSRALAEEITWRENVAWLLNPLESDCRQLAPVIEPRRHAWLFNLKFATGMARLWKHSMVEEVIAAMAGGRKGINIKICFVSNCVLWHTKSLSIVCSAKLFISSIPGFAVFILDGCIYFYVCRPPPVLGAFTSPSRLRARRWKKKQSDETAIKCNIARKTTATKGEASSKRHHDEEAIAIWQKATIHIYGWRVFIPLKIEREGGEQRHIGIVPKCVFKFPSFPSPLLNILWILRHCRCCFPFERRHMIPRVIVTPGYVC